MKQVSGSWMHVCCLLIWNLESQARSGGELILELQCEAFRINKLVLDNLRRSAISASACYLCQQRGGLTVGCSSGDGPAGCSRRFHPTCAYFVLDSHSGWRLRALLAEPAQPVPACRPLRLRRLPASRQPRSLSSPRETQPRRRTTADSCARSSPRRCRWRSSSAGCRRRSATSWQWPSRPARYYSNAPRPRIIIIFNHTIDVG